MNNMNNPKQILWTDLNSEPPKNYLWQKEDGIYNWINNIGWKKIMSSNGSDSGNSDSGGGDVPSKEVTIDDVVKFMHDAIAGVGYGQMFPYETWDEIPNIINAGANTVGKSTTDSSLMQEVFLHLPGYIIGIPKSM